MVKPKTLQIHAVSNSLLSLSCVLSHPHPSITPAQYLCCGYGSINIRTKMKWAEERIKKKKKSKRSFLSEAGDGFEIKLKGGHVSSAGCGSLSCIMFIFHVLSVHISSVILESRKDSRCVCLF